MTLWLRRIGIEEVLESFPVASNNKWEAEPIRRKFEKYTNMKLIKGILTYFFYMYGGIRAEPSYNWRHYTIQDWFKYLIINFVYGKFSLIFKMFLNI